jgi:phosphomannomutase
MFELDAPDVRFAVRPSGTEPKIKFYLFARTDVPPGTPVDGLATIKSKTAGLLAALEADLKKLADEIVNS